MKQLRIGLVTGLLIEAVCTGQTPRLVRDINQLLTPTHSNPRPTAPATDLDATPFLTVLHTTYFVADHPTLGAELFEMRGSAATAKLSSDIRAGTAGSEPRDLMTDSYRLFFSADDGVHGRELWIAEPLLGTVRMVKDINTGSGEGSNPQEMVHLNGVILFQATDYRSNTELWRTDGTAKNTYLVKELAPGIMTGSAPRNMHVWNGHVYFQAFDGAGFRLWRTDGTAKGTERVQGVSVDTSRGSMVEYRGDLYFSGRSMAEGVELWRIDGKQLTPSLVHDIQPGPKSSGPDHLTVCGGNLYFTAAGVQALPFGLTGEELWKTDGKNLTLFDLHLGATGSNPHSLITHASDTQETLFLVASGTVPAQATLTGEELWCVDASGAQIVELVVGENGSLPHGLAIGPGGDLYFSAWSPEYGQELYRSDGTVAGTGLFKRLNTYRDPMGSRPAFFSRHRALGMIFACDDGPHGTELWQSDGTVAGTKLLVDLNPQTTDTRGSQPVLHAAVGGSVYLSADADGSGPIVWMTDGTAAGTMPVRELGKVGLEGVMEALTVGGRVFVMGAGRDAHGQRTGFELWVVEHATGAVTLLDVRQGEVGSLPLNLTALGERVFFTAAGDLNRTGPDVGRELWSTDGTVQGTHLVADINQGTENGHARSSDAAQMFAFRGRLYFAARDAAHGLELWVTDGTTSGTRMVLDLYSGPTDSYPHGFVQLGDEFAFVANSPAHGVELYVSDGSAQGTTLIDVRKGKASGFPKWHTDPSSVFCRSGDRLFFAASGDLNQSGPPAGLELWCTDGTKSGTTMVADLWPGSNGSDPGRIAPLGDTGNVVFIAGEGAGSTSYGPAIWFSDGSATGTRLLRRVGADWLGLDYCMSGRLGSRKSYFKIPSYSQSRIQMQFQLYVTDGTAAGTGTVVSDWYGVDSYAPSPDVLADRSGRLFVTRVQPSYGEEVWVIDGMALASPVGRGCTPVGTPPELTCDDPVADYVRPRVRGRANAMGVLMVGMWRANPYSLGRDCRLHVDLLAPQVFEFFATDFQGSWRGALKTRGAVGGYGYAIQACVADDGVVAFTNGVVMTAASK